MAALAMELSYNGLLSYDMHDSIGALVHSTYSVSAAVCHTAVTAYTAPPDMWLPSAFTCAPCHCISTNAAFKPNWKPL